jgi:hypothetical protein
MESCHNQRSEAGSGMRWHKLLSESLMGQQRGQTERTALLTLGRPAVTQGMLCGPRNKPWQIGHGVELF